MNTSLDGDKLENLLWENGLDVEPTGPEGTVFLFVYSGAKKVVVKEGYITADGWYIDADNIGLEVWHDGELIDENYETFEDEDALVTKILTYVE